MVYRWKNVRNIILRKRCKSQKNIYSKVPLIYRVKTFQSLHENNKYQFRILTSFLASFLEGMTSITVQRNISL